MSYLVLVLCHNEVQYIKPFKSKQEAQEEAILLSNEWYNKDGILEWTPHQIETIQEMRSYYKSESYFNSGDYAHVLIEEAMY
ncbi:hypothetical protein [Clostridium sp.]|jgi:hypothetical protein|uniref:hypothetical protein n=1 Tax=Clostridium sp. TaxID=1506 RepID=UPI003EED1521